MKDFDHGVIWDAERRAYHALTSPEIEKWVMNPKTNKLEKIKVKNPHYNNPKLTTTPATLIQELPWVNTVNAFIFDFSLTAPAQIPGPNAAGNSQNNSNITKNSNFVFYGLQILFGTSVGAVSAATMNAALFQYRSYGILPGDNAMYNSTIQFQVESNTFGDKIDGQDFHEVPNNANEFSGMTSGMQIINPLRIISGELGKLQIIITMKNPMATLVVSPFTVLSVRLKGVYGQSAG